jgi:hypothetical protein
VFPGLIARPLRALLVLALLAAVVVGLWLWHRAGSSTPVNRDAAVQEFRTAGGATGSARPGVPRPGVYTFRQSGSERGGIGPVHLSRDLPGTALYVITPMPGGYREDLDISKEHIESVRLRVGPAGVREISRRTKVTFLGVGQDDRRDLTPPPRRFPRGLAVGATLSVRYAAGALPVTVRSRVVRADTVAIEGRRVPVRVVQTVSDTGGTHPGRRTDTLWWSPALSLPLRWTIDMDISGVATLRTRADLALESLTPRV